MKQHKIAIYPGDGIGIEVTHETMLVLEKTASRCGLQLETKEFDWGLRYWEKRGEVTPPDYIEQLRAFDAIFLGAIGVPNLIPDHISLKPLITMRQTFDQYAGVRPATLFPGVTCPLANCQPGELDMVVIRENSEGEYVNLGGMVRSGQPEEEALQTAVHTRRGITRILRYGFQTAMRRRQKLTMATKSNALTYSMVLWDKILEEIRPEFPEVEAEKVHIDALSMLFVQNPQRLDVVVASNLFGDILSDLAGAVSGSIGLAPSANINPEKTAPSLFEPVHGSAPDIAGKGLANPLAAIRSAAMMLDFLGESQAAKLIEKAILDLLNEGRCLTPDLGGTATTSEVGREVADRIS